MSINTYDKKTEYALVNFASKNLLRELLYLAILANSFVFLFALFQNMEELVIFGNWPTTILSGLSTVVAISILLRIRSLQIETDTALISLVIGIILWFSAQIIWTFYQIFLRIDIPYPSIADIIWFIGYFFIGIYIFKSFQYWNRKNPVKPILIFTISSITSIVVLYSLYLIYLDWIIEPEFFSITVSYIYPIADAILFVPSILIIDSLHKKNKFYRHWIFISIFIIFNIVADYGFIYSYVLGEELVSSLSWIWNSIYNLGFISLIGSLLWYDRISHFIDLNIKQNMIYTTKKYLYRSNNYQIYDDGNKKLYKEFFKKIHDINELDKIIFENKKNIDSEILFLSSASNSNDFIIDNQTLLDLINKNISNKINFKILIKKQLLVNTRKYKNCDIQYILKPIKANLIFIIIDRKSMIMLENNKETKEIGIYTNNEDKITSYISIFENFWLLSVLNQK